MKRLPLIAALCLAVGPAGAQITAPLGSDERTDQILSQAHGLSGQLFGMLEEQANRDAIQEPVIARLAEACANLYVSEPDDTITNPLCYDVFLRNGLPD